MRFTYLVGNYTLSPATSNLGWLPIPSSYVSRVAGGRHLFTLGLPLSAGVVYSITVDGGSTMRMRYSALPFLNGAIVSQPALTDGNVAILSGSGFDEGHLNPYSERPRASTPRMVWCRFGNHCLTAAARRPPLLQRPPDHVRQQLLLLRLLRPVRTASAAAAPRLRRRLRRRPAAGPYHRRPHRRRPGRRACEFQRRHGDSGGQHPAHLGALPAALPPRHYHRQHRRLPGRGPRLQLLRLCASAQRRLASPLPVPWLTPQTPTLRTRRADEQSDYTLNLRIPGSDARLPRLCTINAQLGSRLLNVSAAASLRLQSVALLNGRAPSFGAAIFLGPGATAVLAGCVVAGCAANGVESGLGGGLGGGVFVSAPSSPNSSLAVPSLVISGSLFRDNSADYGAGDSIPALSTASAPRPAPALTNRSRPHPPSPPQEATSTCPLAPLPRWTSPHSTTAWPPRQAHRSTWIPLLRRPPS